MPTFSPGTIGAKLHFTARIPTDAAERLAQQGGNHASFPLTPDWGVVPEMSVRKLRKRGVEVPAHWTDEDVLVPTIHGQAFYIGDIGLGGGAVSFSMKGVNLRTGRPETDGPLSDHPSQTYWAAGVHLPWIDGYVPSDGQAVRQFVPLKGDEEMRADVATHVGISRQDPFIDALRGRFFAPVEFRQSSLGMARSSLGYLALESLGVEADVPKSFDTFGGYRAPRGIRSAGGPRDASFAFESLGEVGMGAGARMSQRHEHNPHVKAEDFRTTPWFEITFRLVWVEQWNSLAEQFNIGRMSDYELSELARKQQTYETTVRRALGIYPHVHTEVDGFPNV